MKYLYSFLYIYFYCNTCFSADLLQEIFLEEPKLSDTGEWFTSKRTLQLGESYTNSTIKKAKLFFSDKVVVSLEKNSKIKIPTQTESSQEKISLIFTEGIARFKVKKLKREAFNIRLPSAVAGVRGTKFSIYIEETIQCKLLTGSIAITDNQGLQKAITPGQKISVINSVLQEPQTMSSIEFEKELGLIDEEAKFIYPKLEEEIQKYQNELKDLNEEKHKGLKKEKEEIQKVIEHELEKANLQKDEESIRKLKGLKVNFLTPNHNFEKIQKLIDLYYKRVDYNNSKVSSKEKRASALLNRAFDKEISKAKSAKDLDQFYDLHKWKQEVILDSDFRIDALHMTNSTVWFPRLVKLPAEITLKFTLNDNSAFIPAYSYNKRSWGQGDSDALTWYISAGGDAFTFRTSMFGSFPSIKKAKKNIQFDTNKEYTMKCIVNKTTATYYVDNEKIATATYPERGIPLEGYFGIVVFGKTDIQLKNILIKP